MGKAMLWFRLGLLMVALVGVSAQAQPSRPAYAAGQVWRYASRAGDEGSLLKIGRVETDPAFQHGLPIYHISLIGVHLGRDQNLTVIGHLPVSKETLDKSVTVLTESNAEFPDVSEGIDQWKQANGGVFTISVAEIVAIVDQSVREK